MPNQDQCPTAPSESVKPQPLSSTDAQLAMELVANLRDRKTVAQAYGYSVPELKKKLKDPLFKRILKECHQLWTSDANTKDRVRQKAGFLVEDSLLDVFKLIKNPEVGPREKNEIFKSLTRVASMDAPDKELSQAEGFRVIINMGNPPEREVPKTSNLIIDGEAQ